MLQIPVGELYQYILKIQNNRGLNGVQDLDGNIIVITKVLRYIMHIYVQQMNERHRVTCVCKTCIFVNSLHD